MTAPRALASVMLRRANRRALLLYLDFDGTLAPIRRNPDNVRLSKRARSVLSELAGTPGVRVSIVSGRPLAFLKRAVGIPGVALAGEHASGGRRNPAPKPSRALSKLVTKSPGASIEQKLSGFTVHYRRMKPSARMVFFKSAGPLVLSAGMRLIESKIALDVVRNAGGKGAFVTAASARVTGGFAVAMGDDATDEDMFKAANRLGGFSIRVGSGTTAAKRSLAGITSVVVFLERLLREISRRQARGQLA